MAKRRNQSNKIIKRLKITVAVLAVIIAALAIYIAYPSINNLIKGQPFGKRLTGINAPLSSYDIAIINNASNNNFEIAGEKLLNLSIPGIKYSNGTYYGNLFEISFAEPLKANSLVIDGKPSVIYIGAISCIYCGENRWAMALALSRFGAFKSLYTGYSALGDSDVPTLYWLPQNITANRVIFGNEYQSDYINFFSAEYDSPITGGFQFPDMADPIQYFVANATNQSYLTAMQFMNSSRAFEGTPFTFWGSYINRGADAVVFSNATNATASATSNFVPLTYMSHDEIFRQLADFNTTWSYEEYAAADVYIAQLCPSINNTAQVCSLPAIKRMEGMIV